MVEPQAESFAKLNSLFDEWKEEHREVEEFVQSLSEWSSQHAKLDSPVFPDAARRLRSLEVRLNRHFVKENEIGVSLAEARGIATPEIEAVQRQAEKDHRQLSERLKTLIERMELGPIDLNNWKAAIYEFNLFLDVLEQHEELEAENVCWLITSTPQNRSQD